MTFISLTITDNKYLFQPQVQNLDKTRATRIQHREAALCLAVTRFKPTNFAQTEKRYAVINKLTLFGLHLFGFQESVLI